MLPQSRGLAKGQGGVQRNSNRVKQAKLLQEMRSNFQNTSRETFFKYIRSNKTGKCPFSVRWRELILNDSNRSSCLPSLPPRPPPKKHNFFVLKESDSIGWEWGEATVLEELGEGCFSRLLILKSVGTNGYWNNRLE